jgi:hypothetical protein
MADAVKTGTTSPGKPGGQGKPLYDLNVHLSRKDLTGFYRVHFAQTYKRGMWIARVAGVVLAILGVVDALVFGGGTSAALEAGSGVGFFAISFWMGSLIGILASRAWSGPTRVRYRFYEQDFEVRYEKSAERHPYSDIKGILVSRGVLYLYIGKMQAFVLPRDTLSGRLGEVSAFLQRASGRKAAIVGRAQ